MQCQAYSKCSINTSFHAPGHAQLGDFLKKVVRTLLTVPRMLVQLHDPGWSGGRNLSSDMTTKPRCLEAEKESVLSGMWSTGEWSGKVGWFGQRPRGKSSVSLECEGQGDGRWEVISTS